MMNIKSDKIMEECTKCSECGVTHEPIPPKKKWYQKLGDAIGTAIGQAKFGGE